VAAVHSIFSKELEHADSAATTANNSLRQQQSAARHLGNTTRYIAKAGVQKLESSFPLPMYPE
jgi:hypothetical protein